VRGKENLLKIFGLLTAIGVDDIGDFGEPVDDAVRFHFQNSRSTSSRVMSVTLQQCRAGVRKWLNARRALFLPRKSAATARGCKI
jgi:hypothetical protein